jgi:hypothetical protein
VIAYNKIGQLTIIELNSVRHKEIIKCIGPYQLKNPTCDKNIPISVVRFHKKSLCFIIGCLDGFVYMYLSTLMELRKIKRISHKNVIGLEIEDKLDYLIILSEDNKCQLLSIYLFEIFSEIDLADQSVSVIKGLYWQPKQ